MAIRIRYSHVNFEHYARHKWLRPNYFIKTSLFTKDGTTETIEWFRYCVKYCDLHNAGGLPKFLLAYKTPAESNSFSWYYTIIEKKEPGFREHEMKKESFRKFLNLEEEKELEKGEYDED
jgi:hypothetical protein